MRSVFTAVVCAAFVVAAAPAATGATIGQVDTFQNLTTQGWFAGGLGSGQVPPIPPSTVPTGGPAGAGDAYLQITASEPAGAGSRVVAINGSQWAGNYAAAGIDAIAMDLINLGNTDLTIRLLFEDPLNAPPQDEAVTTFGAFLPSGSGWQHVTFPVLPADLTALQGTASAALSNTTLLRIIHAPTAGLPVALIGSLGVDNITALGTQTAAEPTTAVLLGAALLGLRVRGRRPRG